MQSAVEKRVAYQHLVCMTMCVLCVLVCVFAGAHAVYVRRYFRVRPGAE